MKRAASIQRLQRGFTLVELMVSMVLGLVVVGGALSIIASNRQSYRTNEGLSQLQESARTAFEIFSRDLRQAGATGCDNTGRVGSVLNASTAWWQGPVGITGYDGATADPAVSFGTDAGERVAGTASLHIRGATGNGFAVESHTAAMASFKINAATTPFVAGDILLVCDFDHATMFQVTSYDAGAATLVHASGPGQPGNVSIGLGYPPILTPSGNAYAFSPNSQLVRFGATDWYIGNTGRTADAGSSLYRRRLAPGATSVTEEVVAGVTDLQLRYRIEGANDFVDAASVVATDWERVNAVSITLTVESADARISTDTNVNDGRLQRVFTHLVTLRNRVP